MPTAKGTLNTLTRLLPINWADTVLSMKQAATQNSQIWVNITINQPIRLV